MTFDDIKQGDIIRVNTPARQIKMFSGKVKEVPAQSVMVRVNSICQIAGQPGRKTASCTVYVAADGEDFRDVKNPLGYVDGPLFTFVNDAPAGQTFERA